MTYRILVTKTLDIPKNLHHGVAETEEEAKKMAREKLVELDGDVAIVSQLSHGVTKVLHTFERARTGG